MYTMPRDDMRSPAWVRDETLVMLSKLHEEREKKLVSEIQDMQRNFRSLPSSADSKVMWGMEAKVEAQFAYMRRLVRTEGFVVRTMADFDALDTNSSGRLEPNELQEFIRKRDGGQTIFTLLDVRTSELMRDLDIDGDGRVSRSEWLLYMAYLHWQAFLEENVVEKVVEVTKEYKNDKSGTPVMVENIVQHPPVLRSTTTKPAKQGNLNTLNLNTLDTFRSKHSNSLNNGSAVEHTYTSPDGSVVTTFEHTSKEYKEKMVGRAPTPWCGAC